MALFQLDPQSTLARVRATGNAGHFPTLGASVLYGIAGFTLVSVAGFAPWPIIDRWFPAAGELGLYLACTAIFIGLSGPLLHRLIIGPGSLPRFYKLFLLAFVAYAVVWVGFWVWLRGDAGAFAGLFGGTLVMGAIIAGAFDAWRTLPAVVTALFALNALGYYAGEWLFGRIGFDHRLAGMLLWGLCYGAGLGAGLGVAFHLSQERARAMLGEPRSDM
jgi:hypothetical protein